VQQTHYTATFGVLGIMNEDFFKERAKTVREIADRADPSTKKRLLELANRYEGKPRPPTPLPVPAVQIAGANQAKASS
jgi:hypothetical protein